MTDAASKVGACTDVVCTKVMQKHAMSNGTLEPLVVCHDILCSRERVT